MWNIVPVPIFSEGGHISTTLVKSGGQSQNEGGRFEHYVLDFHYAEII